MNRHTKSAFQLCQPECDDVVRSGYFKAAVNRTMRVRQQIALRGEAKFDHIQDVVAWPDAAEPRCWRALDDRSVDTQTGLRVVKSHLPADLTPIRDDVKFTAFTRDPIDCAASGYHLSARLALGPMTPPPDVWLDVFASEGAICGPWRRFTATWSAERARKDGFFMTFEDMKARPTECIERLAAHLDVDLTTAERARVLEQTSFEAMKTMKHKFYPVRQTIWSAKDGQIIRSGRVCLGGDLFSPDAKARFRQAMAEGLKRAGCERVFYGLNANIEGET
ncbi:MAG: sulfotransferase domain-containing protein [Pseudomonadota bacterium]